MGRGSHALRVLFAHPGAPPPVVRVAFRDPTNSCLEDEMNGKFERMELVGRQSQLLSSITELAVSLRRPPQDVVLATFARLEVSTAPFSACGRSIRQGRVMCLLRGCSPAAVVGPSRAGRRACHRTDGRFQAGGIVPTRFFLTA